MFGKVIEQAADQALKTGGPGHKRPLSERATADGWTEVGEWFEAAPCPHCGEPIPPLVFLESESRRRRYVCKGEHVCDQSLTAMQERKKARLREYEAMLRNPPLALAQRTVRECHLPEHAMNHPGLCRLERKPGDEAAFLAGRDLVKRFQRGERARGLYVWGLKGVGKTTLSTAICFDLFNRTGPCVAPGSETPAAVYGSRVSIQWWDTPSLFVAHGRQMDGHQSDFDESALCTVDVLVLDDLGKEYISDYKLAMLFMIVNHRYNEELACLYTSQYPPAELAAELVARVGEHSAEMVAALIERIEETCDVVCLEGRSWRVQEAA